jgi:hypothetical protein
MTTIYQTHERNLKKTQNEKFHDIACMTYTTAGIIKFEKLQWVGYAGGVEGTSNVYNKLTDETTCK